MTEATEQHDAMEMTNGREFIRRVLETVGIVVGGAAALFLIAWYAVDVLLLGFAGVLLAVFLRSLGDWLADRTPLSRRWALAAVVAALAALGGLGAWFMAPSLADQFDELTERIPQAIERVRERVEHHRWAQALRDQAPKADEALSSSGRRVISGATGLASTTLGAFGGVFVVLVMGLYLAFEPRVYADGLVRLVPRSRRTRAREVLDALHSTLQGWLIGKVFSMAVVGVLTALGLWLLGVPLALTLGILTALLTFIPNLGPILSFVPAALIALLQGPQMVLYVFALFVAIQTVETYLLTPLVQRRAISLPPALLLFSQVLMGVLLGALGVLLATPLMAVVVVLIKMLYVEDALGDPVESTN